MKIRQSSTRTVIANIPFGTVFGQVYEGIEVVDKIAEVKTDGNDKPLEEVKLEKVETSGKLPGWLGKHRMKIVWIGSGVILILLIGFIFVKTRRSGMTRAERRRKM